MPISIEEFEESPLDDLRDQPDPYDDDPLIEFFKNHSNQAFTLRELASQTGIPLIELAARLSTLANDGVVRNRGSYWAIAQTES